MNPQDKPLDKPTFQPTLVLLHAFPLDRAMWQSQLDGAEDRFAVLTVDLPGFGGSPFPSNGCSIDQMADAVAAALDHLKIDQAIIGGLSMGGYVALAFARRHAQRLQGLILADTKAEPDDDAAKANRGKVIALVQEQGVGALIEQMIPKLLGSTTQETRPAIADEVRKIANRQSLAGVVNAVAALRDRPDARPRLADIRVPTLIVVGDEDVVTPPSCSQAMAQQIPSSQLVTIPGAGHLSNLEQPNAFNAAMLDFVASIK